MAITHYSVTLGAGATRMTSVRKGIRHIDVFNLSTNSTIYVGGPTVSATSWGRVLVAGNSINFAFSGETPFSSTDVYFFGTQGDVVHVLAVTH